jgi:CheY-like chemotaxis protein
MQPAKPPGALRVLVVDDDRDSADSLALLLQTSGHLAEVAYNGPSALKKVGGCPPDVVVLDLAMPGMDGYELGRRLRELPGMSAAFFVVLTGYPLDPEEQRYREAGFNHHFLKPAEPKDVERLLAGLARERA